MASRFIVWRNGCNLKGVELKTVQKMWSKIAKFFNKGKNKSNLEKIASICLNNTEQVYSGETLS